MELTTERLTLRDFEPDDWRTISIYQADPLVRRHMLTGQCTPTQAQRLVAGSIACAKRPTRDFFGLAILLRADARLIGSCTLSVQRKHKRAHMGWDFNRQYWNCGFATETAQALLAFAFDTLGLTCVEADCFAANAASVRVLEKCGLRREPNRLREWLHTRRYLERRPMICFALHQSEWRTKTNGN
ncbi:MAG: GNAT family N-acetyltransferase [Armatimonadota bacterium]|nr:GNAT family N-acetyltransferase [Armatimonadota bacterium]